jgi:hypothetical protein
MEVVVQEILQDKIYLDTSGEARVRPAAAEPTDSGPSLADLE